MVYKKSLGIITHKRFNILALVFVSVVINYLDRSSISIVAYELSKSFELDSIQMGLIFSAFGWTYAIMQIPGGILVDRIGSRVLYSGMIFLWSLATLVQAFVNSFVALFGLRALIGVFEAPSFPINNSVVTNWFPENERASAIAIYTSGQYMGLAFLTPIIVVIQNYIGWQGVFIVLGIVGILWSLVWYLFYRDPFKHKKVSKIELDYIERGEGLIIDKIEKKDKLSWKDFKQAFMYRKLWGLYIGQFCLGSLFIFFLTWFPTYLVKYRGLDFLESGFLASIPFLAAFIGVLLSGFTSDFLIKKGYSNEIARKTPVIIGMLLSVVIIGANYTDNTFFVIMFLAISFFGNGLAGIAWIFVSLIAPKQLIGLIGGVFNLMGALSAVVIPIFIGFLVKGGDFKPALFFIGAIALIGFFSYVFLVGKVERIKVNNINDFKK